MVGDLIPLIVLECLSFLSWHCGPPAIFRVLNVHVSIAAVSQRRFPSTPSTGSAPPVCRRFSTLQVKQRQHMCWGPWVKHLMWSGWVLFVQEPSGAGPLTLVWPAGESLHQTQNWDTRCLDSVLMRGHVYVSAWRACPCSPSVTLETWAAGALTAARPETASFLWGESPAPVWGRTGPDLIWPRSLQVTLQKPVGDVTQELIQFFLYETTKFLPRRRCRCPSELGNKQQTDLLHWSAATGSPIWLWCWIVPVL